MAKRDISYLAGYCGLVQTCDEECLASGVSRWTSGSGNAAYSSASRRSAAGSPGNVTICYNIFQAKLAERSRILPGSYACRGSMLGHPCDAASVAGNSTRSWNSEPRLGRAEGGAGSLQPRALYSPKLPGPLSGSASARAHMSMRPPPAPSRPQAGSTAKSLQASTGQASA